MKTRSLSWMGVRTREFAGMVELFSDVLGLELTHAEEEFAILRTGDGDKVEVFGPNWKYNKHFSSAPVVGFLVDDMDEARKRLRKADLELIGEVKKGENGYAWQHFRGPDGNIYEIVFDPNDYSRGTFHTTKLEAGGTIGRSLPGCEPYTVP
jgi:catechol 2,3-dioxygenase-like lactoylglutathione lyase family enzyme